MNDDVNFGQGFPNTNVYDNQCLTMYLFNILGQKWKLPIIWYLAEKDTARYNELKRRIKGITNIMLTKSLRELEELNVIQRTQYNTIPPKVEYSLTESGKSLLPALSELNVWVGEHMKIDNIKKKEQ
ncbi:helix-turn-helix domain-containing protein [Clostridium sp. YIM B02555]|uniref:winged helix-turn-helix transcriptional regulator n=1 Tax=Clostridium sp. YIM B02555 TaxID=2911968 RepID=UPI001EED9014|nr:helix-turn-helix domain-containing protein [Clostridium sp. YIM B02555]